MDQRNFLIQIFPIPTRGFVMGTKGVPNNLFLPFAFRSKSNWGDKHASNQSDMVHQTEKCTTRSSTIVQIVPYLPVVGFTRWVGFTPRSGTIKHRSTMVHMISGDTEHCSYLQHVIPIYPSIGPSLYITYCIQRSYISHIHL